MKVKLAQLDGTVRSENKVGLKKKIVEKIKHKTTTKQNNISGPKSIKCSSSGEHFRI